MEFLGRRTSDTWGTIYPASGPRRENPTCCLSDLVLMMMYRGAVRALVERDLSSPMRGYLDDVMISCVLSVGICLERCPYLALYR